jgi:hypothetical protein
MKRRRKVAAIVLMGAMVVCGETGRTSAQEAPPDLRMLMNMELFEPRHNDAKSVAVPAGSPTDDSMLDQIRALDAMGYLGNHKGVGANSGSGASAPRAAVEAPESGPTQPESADAPPQSDVSAPPPEEPRPASRPSDDAEGPQP